MLKRSVKDMVFVKSAVITLSCYRSTIYSVEDTTRNLEQMHLR